MTYRGEDDIGKRSERRITEFSFRERAKEIDENKSEIDRLRRRIEYLADENTRIRTIKQMPV
jgi:polyhydroxyalkanoate synthesis regulator phasin